MTEMQKLRDDVKGAMRAGDGRRRDLLRTLLSEAARVGKDDGNRETTDAELATTVKKFSKNAAETIAVLEKSDSDNSDAIAVLRLELAVLSEYLPKQMTEAEVEAEVSKLLPAKLGEVMAHFKREFPGLYDGRSVSAVAARLIAPQ